MFQRRKRGILKQTIAQTGDPEVKKLRKEISERQERIAELELEIFDTKANLAQFEADLESRIRPLERQLQSLEEELVEARHRAERRGQWGDRADSEKTPDVVNQFKKAWTPRDQPPAPIVEEPVEQADPSQLKQLYRELAKRFHPDLTPDPKEKIWRAEIMAKVNQAYSNKDLVALQQLSLEPDRVPMPEEKPPLELKTELEVELKRLDDLVIRLEAELGQLTRSQLMQLQLESTLARRSGRDLLGELAADLLRQIRMVESELHSLRSY
jgi:predicted  nucleic acid-binding Zn-ribbon protein